MIELHKLIEESLTDEVKKTISEQVDENKKEVYHIKCEGVPLATFETQEEAEEALPVYKDKHKGELIIEKGVYESHDDMLDKLDEMNDQLEETNMEETMDTTEGNAFAYAALKAKEAGEKTFEFDGETHDVEECWKQMEEEELMGMDEEEECMECGEKSMEEKLVGNQYKLDKDKDGEITKKDFILMKSDKNEEEISEEKGMCSECGAMLNEEGMCNECGPMKNESKKRTVRLTESQLLKVIKNLVSEQIPGLEIYKKAHKGSGGEGKSHLKDVEKKMKDYMSFDGNDNPEFPKQIGKGEKVAVNNTSEQDEEVAKNFAGLQNLNYDVEPSEKFKERLKMAIEGDSKMGNAPITPKASIQPSNGAEKGEESEHKSANTIPTPDTAKKINKQVKDREEDKKKRVIYSKEAVPVKTESESDKKGVLTEEIQKMKNITFYNKKTQ